VGTLYQNEAKYALVTHLSFGDQNILNTGFNFCRLFDPNSSSKVKYYNQKIKSNLHLSVIFSRAFDLLLVYFK